MGGQPVRSKFNFNILKKICYQSLQKYNPQKEVIFKKNLSFKSVSNFHFKS